MMLPTLTRNSILGAPWQQIAEKTPGYSVGRAGFAGNSDIRAGPSTLPSSTGIRESFSKHTFGLRLDAPPMLPMNTAMMIKGTLSYPPVLHLDTVLLTKELAI